MGTGVLFVGGERERELMEGEGAKGKKEVVLSGNERKWWLGVLQKCK